MLDVNEFKNKTLVISGGTRGIGRAIVLEFAKMGVNIAFTYNSNQDLAKEQADQLQKDFGIKARAYELNILEPENYKEVFEEIDKDFDRVDFFISNAIISGRAVAGGYTKFMKLKQYFHSHNQRFCMWHARSRKTNAKSRRWLGDYSFKHWAFGLYRALQRTWHGKSRRRGYGALCCN